MRRALLLLLLVLALPAAAQSPAPDVQGVGVQPAPGSRYASPSGGFVELGTVPPTTPVSGEVVVRNQGTVAREVLLYASDAQPAQGGGFGFSDRSAPDSQVGSWLTLGDDRLTLPAGKEVRVGYRVVVPRGTAGGEYVGAVVVEPATQSGGAGVQTTTRVAMAVYLTVPGGAPGATPGRGAPGGVVTLAGVQLAGADGGRYCPVITYRNDSQAIVDPRATVSVDGLLSDDRYVRPRTGAVLPGAQARVPLPCLDRPLGPSTLRVRLSGPQVRGDYQDSGVYVPFPVVAALLLLLLLVLGLVTTTLRGARRTRMPQGTGPS